jgi:hypothetical protein
MTERVIEAIEEYGNEAELSVDTEQLNTWKMFLQPQSLEDIIESEARYELQ